MKEIRSNEVDDLDAGGKGPGGGLLNFLVHGFQWK